MRKILVLGAAAVLCATGAGAEAAPKATPMTFYFHGTQAIGEADPEPTGTAYRTMDATAPTGSESKSQGFTNYVRGPNGSCAGNSLFPTWIGKLGGEVTGDVKVTFFAAGLPASDVLIELFSDVDANMCNEEFPTPAGAVTVAVPAGSKGKVEAVIKGVKLKAKTSFMINFKPTTLMTTPAPLFNPQSQGRIYYDSTADNSSISFSCVPKAGTKAC